VQEKAPYQAKADKLKAEYAKKMDKYNNPQVRPSPSTVVRFCTLETTERCTDLFISLYSRLQAGEEAEGSGDSDKSKSEINDEEDGSEVRPSTPTQLTSLLNF
jgi:hypothetical protein